MSEDWLAMPMERGGRRFGPLPDDVVIGSDPAQAHIVLASSAGLPDVAVTLRRGRVGWTVESSPGDDWALLIQRADTPTSRPPRPGARLEPGDTLVLRGIAEILLTLVHTPTGGHRAPDDPSLLVAVDVRPRTPGAAHKPAGPLGRGPSNALTEEATRQASARLLARSSIARQLDRVARWIAAGGWKSPAFVVTGALFALTSITATVAALAWILSSFL